MHVAAWRALFGFRYLVPTQRSALEAAVQGESDEYVLFEIDGVDAMMLAGDLSHEIVHGRRSQQKMELFNEAAEALEDALSRRDR
ncbi:MAG: hypothetical protein WCJ30_23140 [Deltaproteobacteria bacterium]